MTPKRLRVLVFIHEYEQKSGFVPSYDEIAKGLELGSLATVHKHITNLVSEGCLIRPRNRSRSINITIRGLTACGHKRSGKAVLRWANRYRDALTQIADGLTTDLTSKHIARVALGWE